MAPVFWAASMSITRACVGWLARISALTRCSISRICSSVTGALCAKSKRVRSALTSEPFCCTWSPSTSRSALCIRCVTEWLRMVACAHGHVDLGGDAVADLERARRQRAVVAEHVGLDLLRVVDLEVAPCRWISALVADLAAALGVERRGVEHHDAVLPRFQLVHRRAVGVERDDLGRLFQLLVAGEHVADARVLQRVVHLELAGRAGLRLLLVHRGVEAGLVHLDAALAADVGWSGRAGSRRCRAA